MKTVAIIPARGGSKGIKRKNLIQFGGKPLICWSIEQALASSLVDEVIVSTDCHEIGEVATDSGATWILRSDVTATDTASSESVLREVLSVTGRPGLVVFLQATSPLRLPGDIDGSIRKLKATGSDSLFSGRIVHGYTWTVGQCVTPNYQRRLPRQLHDIRRVEENGSIYVFKPWVLFEHGSRLGGRITWYEQHPLDSYQIDEPEDVELLESLLPLRAEAWASTASI